MRQIVMAEPVSDKEWLRLEGKGWVNLRSGVEQGAHPHSRHAAANEEAARRKAASRVAEFSEDLAEKCRAEVAAFAETEPMLLAARSEAWWGH